MVALREPEKARADLKKVTSIKGEITCLICWPCYSKLTICPKSEINKFFSKANQPKVSLTAAAPSFFEFFKTMLNINYKDHADFYQLPS
jgi:hypothetical protein